MILGVLGSFLASLAFAVLLETPRKYLIRAGLVGALSGLVYFSCVHFGLDVVISSFIASFFVALLSHIFARVYKAPVTLFLIAGILPTVPGNGMYQIAAHVISGDSQGTLYYLGQTLEISGVIALAIFLMDTIFRVKRNRGKGLI